MKHTEVWYACQMMLYELRLSFRTANPPQPTAGSTTINVPWEIRK